MGKTGGVAAAAIAAAFFSAALGIATAQDQPIELEWRAPAGCPDGESVKAEVRRLLRGGKGAASKPVRVAATVTASTERGGGFRVRIETPSTKSGEKRGREFRGASCAAVADATALVIALMIDPSAAAGVSSKPPASPAASSEARPADSAAPAGGVAPPSAPPLSTSVPPNAAPPLSTSVPSNAAPPAGISSAPPSAPTAVPASAASSASAPSAPAPPPTLSPRVAAAAPSASRAGPGVSRAGRLFGVADFGSLPGLSFGGGFAGGLIYGPWRFEVGLQGWPNQRVFSSVLNTAGVDVHLLTLFTGSCFERPVWRLRFAPCLHLDFASMRAAAFGVTEARDGAHFWLGIRASPMLLWSPLKWLDLTAELSLVLAPIRPEFIIENVGVIYQPSLFAFRFALGPGVRF